MTTLQTVVAFMTTEFPQSRVTVEAVGSKASVVRRDVGVDALRPGGTVSGPVMMEVADVALYVAILGEVGIVPLAVTTSLNINFLRKPVASQALIGRCELLKVGRSLVIGEVSIYSEGTEEPVAHAVGTYALPR
ncbi:MAG: PaaI family thioesterase [Leptothrix ochracea]|uniref:PaaI family thioesterase n=2 Tax=Leptothrix ochracea TaxID=735331 RepID=UPI0034E22905